MFLLPCLIIAKAQTSSCSDITKTIDKHTKEIEYSSPFGNRIIVQKSIYADSSVSISLYFSLQKPKADYSEQTCYITFDDGTTFDFTSSNVCSKEADHLYLYSCIIKLNDDNLKRFEQKKITKFQIANKEIIVDSQLSDKIINWINCMESLK